MFRRCASVLWAHVGPPNTFQLSHALRPLATGQAVLDSLPGHDQHKHASNMVQHSISCSHQHATFSTEVEHDPKAQWEALVTRLPNKINPCNSLLHPAVEAGVIQPMGEEMCVQEAYTPQSVCFGCGPANPDGLQLKSKRIKDGLEAVVTISPKYCAFPGIVNGGIVSALLDCHGNWTAAIALMDKACLPRPPLTLTASVYVSFKEPTPPGVPLLLRSQIVAMKDAGLVGKASVEVETRVFLQDSDAGESEPGTPGEREPGLKLLAVGQSLHKRLGALRALY